MNDYFWVISSKIFPSPTGGRGGRGEGVFYFECKGIPA